MIAMCATTHAYTHTVYSCTKKKWIHVIIISKQQLDNDRPPYRLSADHKFHFRWSDGSVLVPGPSTRYSHRSESARLLIFVCTHITRRPDRRHLFAAIFLFATLRMTVSPANRSRVLNVSTTLSWYFNCKRLVDQCQLLYTSYPIANFIRTYVRIYVAWRHYPACIIINKRSVYVRRTCR